MALSDPNALSAANVGWAVYPIERHNSLTYEQSESDTTPFHYRRSRTFWVDDQRFVFVQYSGSTASVVAVDLSGGLSAASVSETILNTEAFVDATKLPVGSPTASAVFVDPIDIMPATNGFDLTLHLSQPVCRCVLQQAVTVHVF
jgi:hypothetical protein